MLQTSTTQPEMLQLQLGGSWWLPILLPSNAHEHASTVALASQDAPQHSCCGTAWLHALLYPDLPGAAWTPLCNIFPHRQPHEAQACWPPRPCVQPADSLQNSQLVSLPPAAVQLHCIPCTHQAGQGHACTQRSLGSPNIQTTQYPKGCICWSAEDVGGGLLEAAHPGRHSQQHGAGAAADLQKTWASSCWNLRTRVRPCRAPEYSLRWSTPKSAMRMGSSR